jgi:hypothetical protein
VTRSRYSLAASKSNSLIIFGWSNATGKPGSKRFIDKAVYCNQIAMSYKNTLWRMAQYEKPPPTSFSDG